MSKASVRPRKAIVLAPGEGRAYPMGRISAVFKAAWLYDAGKSCGAEANAAKYLAGEACFDACQQAVMTHGGYGYAREYHVERYLRESFVGRIAPVSRELILCFIAEKVLGLPKSY